MDTDQCKAHLIIYRPHTDSIPSAADNPINNHVFFYSLPAVASPRLWPTLGAWGHPYGGYLLPACGSKRKGGQVRFTPQQTQSLERRFANHKYLSPEDRRHLAIQLKLSDRQVSEVKKWEYVSLMFLICFVFLIRILFICSGENVVSKSAGQVEAIK